MATNFIASVPWYSPASDTAEEIQKYLQSRKILEVKYGPAEYEASIVLEGGFTLHMDGAAEFDFGWTELSRPDDFDPQLIVGGTIMSARIVEEGDIGEEVHASLFIMVNGLTPKATEHEVVRGFTDSDSSWYGSGFYTTVTMEVPDAS